MFPLKIQKIIKLASPPPGIQTGFIQVLSAWLRKVRERPMAQDHPITQNEDDFDLVFFEITI